MNTGELYVVATPIGNLEDFTWRARRVLQSVDLILVEDTRHSAKLFSHYDIHTPVLAFHEHNEQQQIQKVLDKLHGQQAVALVSDAGTPLINDPGYQLVRAAHAEGIRVIPVPGASAVITALSAAGLPTDRFIYEGFLPAKAAARQKRLTELAPEQRTLVFYEVPHRIKATLIDMVTSMGEDRPATLARELTKQFETIHHGTLLSLRCWLDEDADQSRGEFVILIQGNRQPASSDEEARRVLQILLQSVSVRDASTM
ncbi:MAG TPA: 16S rRNA (cytidine(1402)-2'-O)-methyltransferase, partial [Gammaproteobacteria bacterium]|nr:16S rRNA (cytidine(1402)-2'-O)-methyltransferase [Gammaproteobacteria bacterium]